MIRRRFIGREMRMEFWHPVFGILLTSEVSEIREVLSGAGFGIEEPRGNRPEMA